ncbi:MAG: tyrosine-type recombinase/integrase [Rhodomicrobium sp.]
MLDDMNARKLCQGSQRSHIYSCKRFAGFLKRSPDTATADDVRRFQLNLIESGTSIGNRNRIMTGVKFLLRVTLRRHDPAAEIYHIRKPVKLGKPLKTRQLSRLFHETADAAGIRKPVTLHSLRRSFATHLLEAGTDIRLIRAVLGHDKLDTTARYTRVATGRIAAIESPLGRLSGQEKQPKKKSKPRAA